MRSRTTASLAEFSDRQTRLRGRLPYIQDESLRIRAEGECVDVNAQGPGKKQLFDAQETEAWQTLRNEETFKMKP